MTVSNYFLFLEGLKCWVCTGDASPLCQPSNSLSDGHNKNGVSEPCPYPDVANNGTIKEGNWSCMIMETVVKSTQRVEITKGCVRHHGAFRLNERSSVYFKPPEDAGIEGYCYTHDDKTVAKREVFYHEITVCLCEGDNCNKRELTLRSEKGAKIREVGFGDIKQKLNIKVSGASTLKMALIIWPLFFILMYFV